MKRIIALLLSVIALFCFGGCDGGEETVTFASYQKGYEATAPKGWRCIPEEEANGTDLLLESPGGSAAFMIFGEAKSDYNLTAEEYYDAVVNMTAYELNTLPDEQVDLREVSPLIVNGQSVPGYMFNFTDESGLNMIFQLYFFETEDAYVRVNASAKVSAFEKYHPILNRIVESIEIK